PRPRRRPARARVHEVLPRAARPVAVAADPERAARARPAAAVGAALGVQLLLLGAPDDRPAVGRDGAPAGPGRGDRPARDRRATAAEPARTAARRAAAARDRRRREVGA